ncbi:MAG: SRPBCC domain-containing protein [Bacteroidia bacterium]
MERLKISFVINASPKQVYRDWLSSRGHSDFTGAEAKITAKPDSKFTAWDGYIWGKNIELIKDNYIKQSWRTSDFDENWPDSILEVKLKLLGQKTVVEIIHSNLQKGDAKKYTDGWNDYYKEPMQAFYGI